MNAFMRRGFLQARRLCTEAAEEVQKKPRYRPKNIVEVGSFLPEKGVGMKFTRNLWIRNGYEHSYWTITKVLEKNKGKLRYYGRLTWKGVESPAERKVRTQMKRGWRYILEGDQKALNGRTAADNPPPWPMQAQQ